MGNKNSQILTKVELIQKAANASAEGITISTMSKADRPLIFVNKGFETLTGYQRKDVIGKNCRFLQGENTDPEAVQALRDAIRTESSCTVELLNYRKDGTPFWNRLSITPIYDKEGHVTHYVGIQSDISVLKETKARLETANKDLQTFQKRILKDLEQAKTVQKFLLPLKLPESKKVRFASLFRPMEELGGDFFDVVELPDGNYGILIADVTGHGIPAAMLTFMSSTTFKNAYVGLASPSTTIELTNKRLHQKMPGDAFVTMFYAIYNPTKMSLTYTQAGHPEAYVVRPSSNEIIPLKTGGTLIGVFSDQEVTFSEKEIPLLPGDKLVFYTDAITDTIEQYVGNPVNEAFEAFLLSNINCDLDELFDRIYDYGLKCGGLSSYSDDFTLVGMEVLE